MSKVLRMGLPLVENLSGLCGNIISLFRRPQLHFGKKIFKIVVFYIKLPIDRPTPVGGLYVSFP